MVTFTGMDKSKAQLVDAPKRFQGKVYHQVLVSEDDSSEMTATAVYFDDGARTLPHTHDCDQLLAVVEGTCVVAVEGERRNLAVGEFAFIRKGQWHWHGAVRGTNACHIAIKKSNINNHDVERRDWDQY